MSPNDLLVPVGCGDEAAFEQLYDRLVPSVFGLIRRVLRNQAQAEEVTQEVFVELWRTATRYDPRKGAAMTFAMTMAHRRAVDRVRAEQAATNRERALSPEESTAYDEVVERVTTTLEHEQVRHCLGSLTALQREAISLAYYSGYTYREVAELLGVHLATIKTRMRDGLIRLRDCLGAGSAR